MKPFSRSDRVSGLIQKVLSDILKKDINDPRLKMATITSVNVSRDLKTARIYFSISGGKKNIKNAGDGFESAKGYIKRTLAKKLGLRYMPDIKFFYDETFDYGSHIDELLKLIKTENESNNTTS
ncbi:MAG: 30S ribosome-binding factor RbfA [Deltaproteobacteria bacterium]|nr:30S ribosome-binding factor RbfA [Deltaproteobacteria bacterium]